MIDIHAHILHNVDDGSATLEEAIEMIQLAAQQGITDIIATPHFKIPKYLNKGVEQSYVELKSALNELSIKMTIWLGNEIYLGNEEIMAIDRKSAYSLAGSDYLLVELPRNGIFNAHEQMLYELQLKNYRIVLAHVDRYDYLMNNHNLLNRFVSLGCYAQITACTLLNNSKIRKMVYALIEKGLVHLVATDCHNANDRAPRLLEAYKRVESSFGSDVANALFQRNARAILNNTINCKGYENERGL